MAKVKAKNKTDFKRPIKPWPLEDDTSMRPSQIPPPDPEPVPVPEDASLYAAPSPSPFTVREVDLEDIDDSSMADFLRLQAVERQRYKEEADAAEELRKATDEVIRSYFPVIGYNRVNLPGADGSLVLIESRGRSESKLSSSRLLEHGVTPETIAECTVPGKEYFYLLVRPRTEKEQDAYEQRMRIRGKK